MAKRVLNAPLPTALKAAGISYKLEWLEESTDSRLRADNLAADIIQTEGIIRVCLGQSTDRIARYLIYYAFWLWDNSCGFNFDNLFLRRFAAVWHQIFSGCAELLDVSRYAHADTINILGARYQIREDTHELNRSKLLGQHQLEDAEILIVASAPDALRRRVRIHELTHAATFALEENTGESDTAELSTWCHCFIEDNPGIINWLRELYHGE